MYKFISGKKRAPAGAFGVRGAERRKCVTAPVYFLALMLSFLAGSASALTFRTDDWTVNFDNSIAYALGMRVQDQKDKILYHPAFYTGDAKFDQYDIVTNRISDLMELQAVYKGNMGFRLSGSAWKDFAYDNDEEVPQEITDLFVGFGLPASTPCAYTDCQYSSYTKEYFMQGADLLDAFVFYNTNIGGHNVYLKAGRLTSYWGNAFFFGFTNIAYSQHPVDFIKGFTQPGSEVKELFLPRTQVSVAVDITPNLSIEGQYFFEYENNLYPEGGTYLGFFNVLYDGPQNNTGFVPGAGNDGIKQAPDTNDNFGIRVSWQPSWTSGNVGFYYREFDEVHPWGAMISPETGNLYDPIPEDVTLYGISYEHTFGLISTGWEVNHRQDTGLNSAPLVATKAGATGDITNVIGNMMVQLGEGPLWQTGILLAEFTYTHLNSVTGNKHLYNDEDSVNCVHTNSDGSREQGDWKDGCSTDDTVAVAFLFDPQWLQVFPGVDLDMPISYTRGITGNAAYTAAGFYAEGSNIFSIGIKAFIKQRYTASLTYLTYHWRTNGSSQPYGPSVPASYSGFGGNGPTSLNDRGWLQLQLKASF